MPYQMKATARRLKVQTVLDAETFLVLRAVPDNVPSRAELTIELGFGRKVRANVATRAIRKVLATLAEHGPDSLAIVLQGALNLSNNVIEDAGLSAQIKAKREDRAAAGAPEPVAA